MPRKSRPAKVTDGTPIQVWLSKDLLARFERRQKALTDPATGRGPSRAALAETLIAVALEIGEAGPARESAA